MINGRLGRGVHEVICNLIREARTLKVLIRSPLRQFSAKRFWVPLAGIIIGCVPIAACARVHTGTPHGGCTVGNGPIDPPFLRPHHTTWNGSLIQVI